MSALDAAPRAYNVVIDIPAKAVYVDGRECRMGSAGQFALVLKLASNPRRVFTREELLVDVWGWAAETINTARTRTLDARVNTLRRALPDGLIIGRRGVGYSLIAPDSATTVKVVDGCRPTLDGLFDRVRALADDATALGDPSGPFDPVDAFTARKLARYLRALARSREALSS